MQSGRRSISRDKVVTKIPFKTQTPLSVSDSIDGSVIPVTPGPGEQTVEP